MIGPLQTFRGRIAAIVMLFSLLGASAWAQDSSGQAPLGDVARKSRKERSAHDHVAAKKVLNEEGQGQAGLTAHACKQQPCSSLSITLPASMVGHVLWTSAGYVPIPLRGHEDDKSHSIRVYRADQLEAYDVEGAKRQFLQDWFSRPYFFGRAAKFIFDEHTRIDGWPVKVTHFTIANRLLKFQGLAVVAAVPTGTFAFACVFREEDSGDATSVCEGIINSAKIEVAEQFRPYVPPADPADDPPDDPPSGRPEDDDPQ
jgi:hypothetical protein